MKAARQKRNGFFLITYLPDISDKISHESVCVLNLEEKGAKIELILYYENQDPKGGYFALCPSKRTNHIRLDKIKNLDGEGIAQCVPYSIHLKSDIPVLCQYTRVDATKPSYSLMTTMGI